MNQLRKPRPLRPGATIGIVATSGFTVPENLEPGIQRLEQWGYRVILGDHVYSTHGHLAGTDAQRAADFNALWARPDVDGIFCARGGYGAMRMLPYVHWDVVRAHPKFFVGFSDITALHAAIEREAGLVTFHGPMPAAFGPEAAQAYNAERLLAAMQETGSLGPIPWPLPGSPDAPEPLTVQGGVAEGRLAGGNLSLLSDLMGTPYEPDFAGRIVIIEDIDEPPQKMERMLTQLLLAGKLQQAAGILFGDSPSCMYAPDGRPALTLLEVMQELLVPLGIPVLYGFPCGHTGWRATLPLGVRARLDATSATLAVLEPAVAW